ncbi:MAG: DUF3990 domain-containing protein [Oscillospiraceae bacterium]|nr:DUF3990 domain-containing protein [Oscillospiraceae bacterium]
MKNSVIHVFHGSVFVVKNPEIRPVTRPLDFGVGFYITTLKKQAEHWAESKAKKTGQPSIVNVYNLNLAELRKSLSTKGFKGTSDNWLDFVLRHRKESAYSLLTGKRPLLVAKQGVHHSFDLVSGEVADDDIFDSIELYESGVISKDELRRRVKIKRKNDQMCFCTEEALSFLYFKEHYNV